MTAGTLNTANALTEIVDALESVGISAQRDDDVLIVDGHRLAPQVVERAHPTSADVGQLVAGSGTRRPALLVADRISSASRTRLRDADWGWLDRRGHLRLWTPGIRIDTDLPTTARSSRGGEIWTTVGREIALAAMCNPTEPVTARRIAPVIGRSVGTTHELITRFTERGLIGPRTHRPLMPELFWEAAERWPDDGWLALPVDLQELAARVGAVEMVRVDERAATFGGAQIPAAGDLPARCYLRTPVALRRATGLADRNRPTRSWVRSAPVRWIPELDTMPPDADHPWAIAHPLVCALRLAADPSRGREMVEAWGIVPGAD